MTVEVGQEAPDFELRDQHGRRVRLSSFRDRQAVVVMFIPFAFSPVCTSELAGVRARPGFSSPEVQLLAVSCDPVHTLRAFAEQESLEVPLLSDFWPHGEVARTYGAFDAGRGCPSRSSYIVDRGGTVRWTVHNPPGLARDLPEQLRVLSGLD